MISHSPIDCCSLVFCAAATTQVEETDLTNNINTFGPHNFSKSDDPVMNVSPIIFGESSTSEPVNNHGAADPAPSVSDSPPAITSAPPAVLLPVLHLAYSSRQSVTIAFRSRRSRLSRQMRKRYPPR